MRGLEEARALSEGMMASQLEQLNAALAAKTEESQVCACVCVCAREREREVVVFRGE